VADQKKRIKVFNMSSEDFSRGGLRSDKTPAELTSDLAEANGFDLSYLSDNSHGELGQGQAGPLMKNLVGPLLIIVVTLGFLIFQLTTQGFFKRYSMGTPLAALTSEIPQAFLIIGGILLAVALFGIFLLISTLLDLFGGAVVSLEGPGWKKVTTSTDDDGSTTTRTYYVVADQRFNVKSRGFRVLENGRNYRVYFTPRRKILVNIEAMD